MINITGRLAKKLYLAEFNRNMVLLENINARELKPILNRQYISAAKLVQQGVWGSVDYAVDSERNRLLAVFDRHYRRVATSFSRKAFKIIENSKSIDVPELKTPQDEFWRELNTWMTTWKVRKVTGIQRVSKRLLSKVIQKGMNEGLSHREIAKNLRRTGRISTPFRARTIALTETHTVAVRSVDAAVKSTRIEMEKEWLPNIDRRTRPDHVDMDGKRVGQDAVFLVGGMPMKYPGDPAGGGDQTIRCRCALLYFPVKRMDRLKPHRPTGHELNPMNSVGGLANCVGVQKRFIGLEIKKPVACRDYVRAEGQWRLKGREVSEGELKRLNGMGLPPAWKNVTVSTNTKAKIQAIGMDKAGRWQYRYSADHVAEGAKKKFNRVKLFSKDMPLIRKQINKGIADNDSRAFLLELENKTAIRMGSAADFRAKKKAYGLTTLQHEHVQIKGNKIILDFVAKEGIPAHYELTDRTLAAWLKDRKAATSIGEKLFPDIPAGKLNAYLKKISGKNYTIKDFRTYHGTRIAFEELKGYAGEALTTGQKKKIVKEVSEKVGKFLANTPAMAKKSYIDPMAWDFIGGL